MKVENMNMNVIEQSTTICPESRDTDLHTSISQEYQTLAALELPSSVSMNKGEDIIKKVPKSEQVLIDQQHALEENEASRKLQLFDPNSQLSPVSYQSFYSGAEASGSFPLPSITDTTATLGPPLASDAAMPPLLRDLLSRLHLFLSSEAMSYLRDGFSRYPWALCLLESWSDKSWNWSYFFIFARVLCILQTTTATNLSEALCAELSSSLSTLGKVCFDANWVAAVQTRIHGCQVSLTNLHEAKVLRATKDAIAGRLI
ncbi:hypothetical protein L6164_003114 [Bauhinia variegata]|uniref:Uncharacterized protein n=1 Tax=Bauhinia variegata TaxID=167791 RepID=A0ACB9Q2F6_BAUVA|nr:hypothetical protein L6164_003114 [Bauhinia variegata]